ncbi:NAD(P)H dehydrogenase (quinone) [Thalassobacillus cyri]|uniref:NAD(P)H dehydrogenase (Quinone) n=1 Tax=Thalassobacillus cyri TaxID=571932 RepID=A0A1H3W5S3_9BACI|nr:NAD(P)H dehydrogenase (quinone) [Thalassobacillus cyri]
MGIFDKLFGKPKEMEDMSNVRLAVIFYTMSGTNYQMAKWAEEGAREAGAEVKVLKAEELCTPIRHRGE